MTASATAITAPTAGPVGPGKPAGPNAAALAANPLAGFEALLGALLPQPAKAAAPATAVDAKAATPTIATTPIVAPSPTVPAVDLAADAIVGEAGENSTDAAIATETDTETAEAVTADPDTALAVCVLPTPIALTEVLAKESAGQPLEGGPLRGRVRPLTPFSVGPAPHAIAAGKAELAPEAAPEGDAENAVATTLEPRPVPAQPTEASAPAAPAWGRDKPAGVPAAPALQNANLQNANLQNGNPRANLATKAEMRVADAPPPPPAAPAAPAPVETVALASTAPLAPRVEPTPQPNRTVKASKTEHGKGVDDTATASDLITPAAAGKPATARAVSAAAKPASAAADAAESGVRAPRIEADHPEATPLAETRAAADTPAPIAHAGHTVRGSPETVANLAAQIVKKLESKSTRFDLELNPLGLGKVNVRLEIGAQGALTAAMSFDNPQAAAELRGRAAELQRALEQAGFNLAGGLTFDVAGDRGQQQHGQAWQDQGEAAGRAFRGQAFRAALDTADDAAQTATNGALRLRRGVTAGLDVRI